MNAKIEYFPDPIKPLTDNSPIPSVVTEAPSPDVFNPAPQVSMPKYEQNSRSRALAATSYLRKMATATKRKRLTDRFTKSTAEFDRAANLGVLLDNVKSANDPNGGSCQHRQVFPKIYGNCHRKNRELTDLKNGIDIRRNIFSGSIMIANQSTVV